MKCLGLNNDVNKVKGCLYVSHLLSSFGERAWDFMAGLLLLQLGNNSLRFVAALGLSEGISGFILGPYIGHYIDRCRDRYKVACQLYILQNAGILLACIMALFGLHVESLRLVFSIGLIFFSVCGRLGLQGSIISVARDWTKALFFSDPEALAKLNSGMMAVDLTCLLVAPILSGALMGFLGDSAAVVFLGGYNALVWIIEVVTLKIAINIMPSLQFRTSENPQTLPNQQSDKVANVHEDSEEQTLLVNNTTETTKEDAEEEEQEAIILSQTTNQNHKDQHKIKGIKINETRYLL
eukprot:TRINITY_DN10131_c0_g1_i1.p1 TRINITY_DN10131_c0_g1~~TRINITY_DN10131_c0_g1_i1.p1  ORF type:complete len:295 (+),score=30.00 TRINITY_DN10131_c0_g1_i1:102-986(+)